MAQRQAAGPEQGLGLRAAQARLEGRGHRHLVDGQQALHPHQVEADHAGEALAARGEPARHAGAATEGHDRDPVLGGPRQHRGHLAVAVGAHDCVGGVVEVPRPRAQQVGRGLAAGAQRAGGVVEQHVLGADDRAQAVEEGLVERGCGRPGAGHRRALAGAEGELDQAARGLRQVAGAGGVAPALGMHLDGRRPGRHALQCDT